MWFMYLLSWIAMVIQICFITLSIAAGLYYLAELVEEYTVITAKIIKYMIWEITGSDSDDSDTPDDHFNDALTNDQANTLATTGAYVGLLLFESMPLTLTGIGLLTNILYGLVLKSFPYFELTSPVFLSAIVFIVINHYLAFSYFASVWHPFNEVLAFFTVCLWMIPFAFFVSLSANENVLPTSVPGPKPDEDHDVVTNYFRKNTKRIGLLSFLKTAQDTILPQRVKKGY